MEEAPVADAAEGGSTTVFVGNLAWVSTEDSITEYFSTAGKVNSVRIGGCSVHACRNSDLG